MTGQHFALIVS